MVAPYCEDGTVEAYTGDIGIIKSSCFTMEKNKATCGNNKTTQTLCDYGTGGNPVAYKNGNSDTTLISYDGHPGYDYRTKDQTPVDGITGHIPVLAAAGGTAHVITNWKFGTVWIDHGNGYSTHYLHLSGHLGIDGKDIDGKTVNQGDQIGIAGETNATGQPHLHFEVRQNNIPIDPYANNLWASAQADTSVPTTPTGLSVTATSSNQINLSWTASPESDVAGYNIYRSGTKINATPSSSYSDTGLSASTQYCYTVSAYDASNNESSQSSSVCATTQSTGTIPSVSYFKINNGASSSTSRTVTLNNTATGSPTHYMASESSTFSGASWQTYSTAPSFTLSSGNAAKTVYFKVKNSTGESTVISDSISLNEASTTQYTLTVSKSGTGSGTVTSSTGGISCGSTCTATYNSGTSVTLTASASSGSTSPRF